jgi:hypothetical protein
MRCSRWRNPDFLILGAAKAGTTALHYYLGQHPKVWMPQVKETHWLDYHWNNGGIDEYRRRFFSDAPHETVCGEATPSYLMLPFVADRIQYYMPDVRMIAVLREPVERAFSSWSMLWSRGQEHLGFEQAIAANRSQESTDFLGHEGERLWQEVLGGIYRRDMRHRIYLEEGHYDRHLAQYFHRFARQQFYVVVADDLKARPAEVVGSIFEWLGLDPTLVISTEPKNEKVAGLAVPARKMISRLGGQGLVSRLPDSWRQHAKRVLSKTGPAPTMSDGFKDELRQYFRPVVTRVGKQLSRDMWPAAYCGNSPVSSPHGQKRSASGEV